jgi:hypothetical protein
MFEHFNAHPHDYTNTGSSHVSEMLKIGQQTHGVFNTEVGLQQEVTGTDITLKFKKQQSACSD